MDYNNLYNVEYGNANGTYNISKKSTDEIASSTGATQNQASAINALSNGNSANEAFNSVANNVTELLQSSNSADVKKSSGGSRCFIAGNSTDCSSKPNEYGISSI